MKSLFVPLVVFALSVCAPSLAKADTFAAQSLKGLRTLSLLVEPLNADAKKCGVTEQSLYTDLNFVLAQSRINVVSVGSPEDGYIYLNVLVTPTCIAMVSLNVKSLVTNKKSGTTSEGIIWETGGYSSVPLLSGQVDEFTKDLVVDWSSVNK